MDLRYHFQNQIVCQCAHCRPVFDVWSEFQFFVRISHTFAVKYTVLINCFIKEIFRSCVFYIQICSRCQITFVGSGCSDGTCIHQCYGSDLSILQFGTFTVREVSGCMTDTESVVIRCITGTETWSTECSLHNCTCLHDLSCGTIFY